MDRKNLVKALKKVGNEYERNADKMIKASIDSDPKWVEYKRLERQLNLKDVYLRKLLQAKYDVWEFDDL
jgi:hypothetical protein